MRHWLDTNAYVKLFRADEGEPRERLTRRLTSSGTTVCTISTISSLEIHSVLGKYARAQRVVAPVACDRLPVGLQGICPHHWQPRRRRSISPLLLAELRKIIRDAENCRGQLQITVEPIDPAAIERGRQLLERHGSRIRIGSHDALIAGCFAVAIEAGRSDCFVTSDRSLKNLLRGERLPHYDPENDLEWLG